MSDNAPDGRTTEQSGHSAPNRSGRLVVLESFKTPSAATNPYIVMLYRSLSERCDVITFSWKSALIGHYDVFHVHWPEIMLRSERRSRRIARRTLFAALLTRLRITAVPVVRTMHNITPHEAVGKIDTWLLRRLDSLTTGWIRLNEQTQLPAQGASATILLGHFREWFAAQSGDEECDPNRLLFFGLIRPYKGVLELLEAFAQCPDRNLTLHVVGAPNSTALEDEISRVGATDPRVTLRLEHVSDAQLASEIRRASLVVLPYQQMHNSAALLNALSLDRPVLVPSTVATRAMAQEVGSEWVRVFEGPLTPEVLARQFVAVSDRESASPDLSHREWDGAAAAHLKLFERVRNL